MGQYFYEAFKGMTRLGPGSRESTKRAMGFLSHRDAPLAILDVGCGRGAHTLMLAEEFPGAEVTAIDIDGPNIEQLNAAALARGLGDRVHGRVMSMFEMDFPQESMDLIWAEGSIYLAGFSKGIRNWKRFLKPGGYLVCSEISWLTENPSQESREFWNAAYGEMNTIHRKIQQIKEAGYEAKGYFVCPASDWTLNYYDQIQNNINEMRERYASLPQAMEVVNGLQQEINLYRDHSREYSYVFYAMRKPYDKESQEIR